MIKYNIKRACYIHSPRFVIKDAPSCSVSDTNEKCRIYCRARAQRVQQRPQPQDGRGSFRTANLTVVRATPAPLFSTRICRTL